MLEAEKLIASIPLALHSGEARRAPGRGDGGLLSTLSSYLLTPYNPEVETIPEATESDIENALCTIDCITACRLDELYAQVMYVRSLLENLRFVINRLSQRS